MSTSKRPTTVPKMKGVEGLLSRTPFDPLTDNAFSLEISQIQLPKKQPRRYFDAEKMAQLVQSVREHGILEPLLVRSLDDKRYELVAGERRLRAAQEAGLIRVPVVCRELDDQAALKIAILENLQREDLNPVEETEAILDLLAINLNQSTTEVISLLNRAKHAKNRDQSLGDNVIPQLEKVDEVLLGIGRFTAESFRANRLPLLNLPSDVLAILRAGRLEYTKARAISRIKNEAQRQEVLEAAISQKLSLSDLKVKIAALIETAKKDSSLPSERLTQVLRAVKEAKVWEDAKKKRRLEKLLSELEALTTS